MTAAVACTSSLNVDTIDPQWGREWMTYSGSSYEEGPVGKGAQAGAVYRWRRLPTRCVDIATMFGPDVYACLSEFQGKLRELATLTTGWDDEASPPPNPDMLSAAESLMRRLLLERPGGHEPLDCYADIPLPFPSPIPGGALQLEWRSDRRYLEFEFVDRDTVAFLRSENGWFKIGHAPVENIAEIRRLLDWFMRP